MKTATSAEAFVEQLTARNFEQLAGTLAPDAVARFLLPRGPEEIVGGPAIARRIEGWFGGAEPFTVVSLANERIGHRRALRWRFQLSRNGTATEVIEQVAFMDEGPAGVTRLDLLCSGFLPDVSGEGVP